MATESKSTWITKQEISVMSTVLLVLIKRYMDNKTGDKCHVHE